MTPISSRLRAAGLASCVLLCLHAGPGALPALGADSRTLELDGVTRSYRVHVPRDLAAAPAPLLFAFHGGGSHGKGMERVTGFDALADREHFIVVYPDGLDKHWNDGREATSSTERQRHSDDVAFVSAMIDAIAHEHAIDPRRIYAAGISNGAIFSHYLAARLAPRIAAIAPVCGGVAERFAPEFAPQRPVSVFVIQGTRDPLMPFDGGEVRPGNRGRIVPTKRALELWTRADGLTGEPQHGDLPDAYPKDGCTVKSTRWGGGREGVEVLYYEVEGGGHTWPGGYQYLPKLMIGRTCRDFDASAAIWEFFKAHPRP